MLRLSELGQFPLSRVSKRRLVRHPLPALRAYMSLQTCIPIAAPPSVMTHGCRWFVRAEIGPSLTSSPMVRTATEVLEVALPIKQRFSQQLVPRTGTPASTGFAGERSISPLGNIPSPDRLPSLWQSIRDR